MRPVARWIVGQSVIGLLATGAGAALASSAARSAPDLQLIESAIVLPSPDADRVLASSKASYRVRLLDVVGTRLSLRSSTANIEGGLVAIDQWAVDSLGRSWHVWQTNQDLKQSGKDPVSQGSPLTIAGQTWSYYEHPSFVGLRILSARLADGTTLSIDAHVPQAELERVAALLVT